MVITRTNGYLGLGVTSPNEKLHIDGNILQNSGNYIITEKIKALNSTGLKLVNYYNEGITVNNEGDIGIGTDNPDYNMHILKSGGLLCVQNSDPVTTDGETYASIILGSDFNPEMVKMSSYRIEDNYGSFKTGFSLSTYASGGLQERIGINHFGFLNFSGGATFNETIDVEGVAMFLDKVFIGLGGTSMAQLGVVSDALDGLVVETDHDFANGYGIKSAVDNSLTKALSVTNSGIETFRVYGDGETYIDNTLYAKEIEVRTPVWGDVVFDDDYELLKLSEVEEFIKENNHLPDVPSATEVIEKGVNLGEMDKTLLMKIEELTLYIIELNKMVEDLNEQNEFLNNKIDNLKNQ